MLPGTYAVRCELGCNAVKVSVGLIGTAWLKGTTGTAWTWWPLQSREHGEVRPLQAPEKTNGGDQYPKVP